MHGSSVPQAQINITMKKNFIYTVTFLLCGALFFSSCEDMLNVESNRVEYEFDDWTMNDSVYSVLGILKGVQKVGDRQVLINELRADLVSLNDEKAVVDIQELSKSEFNLETNKYLDVKDYYAIINNCNIFFARVDTTLEKNGIKVMLPEYVAVKTIRAWTYLQLAINHNEIPYFTHPLLTHSAAEEVMKQPKLSRQEVISKLIDELLPFENPAAFQMPSWSSSKDGVIKFGYGSSGTVVETKKLFMPVRMLLGDLYLWRGLAGDYSKAARLYCDLLTAEGVGATTSGEAKQKPYPDNKSVSKHNNKDGENFNTSFSSLFSVKGFKNNISANIFTLIPYTNSSLLGTVSELADVFLPVGDAGGSQVLVSPAMSSLSERQIYHYASGTDLDKPDEEAYSNERTFKTKGDLRLLSTTCYQIVKQDEQEQEFKNLIAKFNLESNEVNMPYLPNIPTTYIVLSRPEHAYLRFAEALMGIERAGYEGAMELAMTVLKSGVKEKYLLLKDPVYVTDSVPYVNSKGDTIRWIKSERLESCTDSLVFNFSAEDFQDNKGIHSRGSGYSEGNIYYALDTINVARYMGKTVENEMGEEVVDVNNPVTQEDFRLYVSELILDEMALELAWEGSRFGDLIRVATALGDPDILAKRVAGREFRNTVSHRNENLFQYDPAIYGKMSNESNWYIPLPGDVVESGDVEETPEDFDVSEGI